MPEDFEKPCPDEVRKTFDKVNKTHKLARARAHSGDKSKDCTTLQVRTEVVPLSSLSRLLDEKIGIEKAVEVLLAQMDAVTTFYDLTAKELVTRPDGKTRLAAVELFLAYREGRPVERKIIETHHVDSLDDLKTKLAQSPALCEELGKLIEAAKVSQNGSQ
jgi:hypothetical protein